MFRQLYFRIIIVLSIMGSTLCNSCNSQPQLQQQNMYRGTTNSSYGSHYSAHRGYSVNPRGSSIVNTKPVGLENLTNTCYISAILQILFMILPESMNKKKGKITELYFKLRSTKDTRDYKMFKMQAQKSIEIVKGFEQQDAQEFLVYFLELLDRENSELYKKTVPNLDYKQRISVQDNYKIFMTEMKKIENSTIIDLFSAEMISQFRCDRNHYKHKIQRYQCLSLFFPTPTSSFSSYYTSNAQIHLKQLLQKTFQCEKLNGLMCEQCKKNTNFDKETYLYTLPNYLILHLSRFKQGYISNEKINTNVEFDEQLTLKQNIDNSTSRYKLIGTINHFGSMNRGHYFAELRHTDGKWYEINDQVVREGRLDKTGNVSKYVYILFYQRQK